uniref:Uncharacterized protein n=1 Tax=Sphaerodactylus townsendi TaxID=933632 RepID=A0ACB8EG02_9SAUR
MSEMCGIPKNFVTAVRALAIVSLSLRLCVAKVVYAEKGSSVDLPCPCLHCPEQNREMNWYFDQKGAATLLFRKAQHSRVERHPAAWDRLEMLPNYSLRFSNVSDNDTCRYWCEQNNYYDLVVVTGKVEMLGITSAPGWCLKGWLWANGVVAPACDITSVEKLEVTS